MRQTKKKAVTDDEIRAKAKEITETKKNDLYALAITVTIAFVAICILYTAATVSMMDAKIDVLQAKMDAEHSPFCYVYNEGQKMYGVDDGMAMNECKTG
jgi:cell division protein FtsL